MNNCNWMNSVKGGERRVEISLKKVVSSKLDKDGERKERKEEMERRCDDDLPCK